MKNIKGSLKKEDGEPGTGNVEFEDVEEDVKEEDKDQDD